MHSAVAVAVAAAAAHLDDGDVEVAHVGAHVEDVLLDVDGGDVAVVGAVERPEARAERRLDALVLHVRLVVLVNRCDVTKTARR